MTEPRWPVMMLKSTTIRYTDLSEAAFVREVAAGRLPQPVTFGGRDHWYRPALDKALAYIAGDAMPDYEREFWARGKAA